MAKKWVVVGGGGNGIIVRSGKDVSSSAEAEKLATGAVVTEQEISGTRMKYAKVSGSGPQTGWVSISAAGKDLLVEVKQSDGGQAADALTKVVSGAFDAEEALAIFDSLSNKKDKAAGTLLTTIPDLFLEEQNPVAAGTQLRMLWNFSRTMGTRSASPLHTHLSRMHSSHRSFRSLLWPVPVKPELSSESSATLRGKHQ
jgi:hypothetical protein